MRCGAGLRRTSAMLCRMVRCGFVLTRSRATIPASKHPRGTFRLPQRPTETALDTSKTGRYAFQGVVERMRVFAHCAAVGVLAAGLVAPPRGIAQQPAAQPREASTILAAARQALGGDKKLSAVKSFTATGRTRQVRGDNLVPIEFELFVELPDKYLKKDEIPAQETGVTGSGFSGDDLLVDPPPPAPLPEPARKTRLSTLKQDFARLALGMFAGSFASYPLTFTYVGQAEAPQGKADVLDAKGPDGITLRYFINSETHLPIMVTWQPPAGRAGGLGAMPPGRAGAPPAGAPPAAAPRPEFRVYFADYRDVDGMQFPFRLRRATGADTTEETTFDRFKVNPKIDPKKFDVRK